jgi:hypothetical protein
MHLIAALEIYIQWLDRLILENTRLLDAGCGPGGLVKGVRRRG